MLTEKIPNTAEDPISYIHKNVTNSIFIRPVTEEELIKMMKNLKHSSSGWDELCPSVIKSSCTEIVSPLLHICNISLLSGIFPNELKIAKVIPLYKSGDVMQLVNYRPVSICPSSLKF